MDRRKFLLDSCKSCVLLGAGLIMGSSLLESCATTGAALIKAKEVDGQIAIPIDSLIDKKVKIIRVSGHEYDIAVRQLEDGSYLALLLKCTHAGQPLTKTGNGFYCTLHGSQFSPEGIVKKGPAPKSLTHLKTEIFGTNLIIR